MGSGGSGPYSGTSGGSQPYAERYHVVSSELANDRKDPDIYDPKKGYFKNPTAVDLEESMTDSRVIFEGKSIDGKLTYVLDKDGNIIFGKRANPNDGRKRAPHPTLIGGKDPQVQCAGMITFKKGRILAVDNHSGHYRPNKQSMDKVNAALKKLYDRYPNAFDKSSKWRKNQ